MDYIKEAFYKVKQDIDSLKKEIGFLRSNLTETREKIIEICEIIKQIDKPKNQPFQQPLNSLDNTVFNQQTPIINQNTVLNTQTNTSTDRHINPTHSTHPSTHNLPLEALKQQNIPISNGNQGVSTDRQTDTSTDRQTQNILKNQENSIENAVEILDSLDSIKKEIRLKFKRLTEQELLVFSTIYQLDEEIGNTDYQTISKKLNLTESSIRDYVGRLIKKGIPIEKSKINNKNIQLFISKNLKKIASLQTILQLRDI